MVFIDVKNQGLKLEKGKGLFGKWDEMGMERRGRRRK